MAHRLDVRLEPGRCCHGNARPKPARKRRAGYAATHPESMSEYQYYEFATIDRPLAGVSDVIVTEAA